MKDFLTLLLMFTLQRLFLVKCIMIEAAVIYSRLLQMAHGQQLVLTYSTCIFVTGNLVSPYQFQLGLRN